LKFIIGKITSSRVSEP